MSKEAKKILEKYGYSPPSEVLFEINKNIKQLADVIINFETKRSKIKINKIKNHGTGK